MNKRQKLAEIQLRSIPAARGTYRNQLKIRSAPSHLATQPASRQSNSLANRGATVGQKESTYLTRESRGRMHQTKATIHQALSPVKHLFDQDHPMGKIAKTPQEETTLELVSVSPDFL